jgi:hypothetical protein
MLRTHLNWWHALLHNGQCTTRRDAVNPNYTKHKHVVIRTAVCRCMWIAYVKYEASYSSFLYVRVAQMFPTDLQRALSPSVYGSVCILVYLPCQSEKIWRRRCGRRRSPTTWHAVGHPFIATSLAAKSASSLPRRPKRSGTRYPDLHNPFRCNYVCQIIH